MNSSHLRSRLPVNSALGRDAGSPRRRARISIAVALLCGAATTLAAPPPLSQEGPWAKGRILVVPKPGLSGEQLSKIVGAHGGKARKITASGLHVVELPGNASERAIAMRLAKNPHLQFAELDMQVPTSGVANDPYFGSAWHLPKVNAPSAWDTTQGKGVTIAVIDTGVDGSHPDLSGKLVPGWNFYDNNSNASDVAGHGTGVAGAAAAATNNSIGVASIAGHSMIMPIRATDTNGVGYISMIAQGISYAADKGAKVINLSFDRLWTFSTVRSAAEYAKSKGALVFIAASNNAMDEGASAQTAMIPVSATDKNDKLASFSSWGNHVALSAPGLEIWSLTRGGGYGAWWGTSVSSPVAAGVAALVMSTNPALSNTQVESLLFSTSRDLGAAGRDKYFGHGLVDASAAVAAAAGTTVAPSDTQSPSVSISAPLASSTVSGLTTVNVNASDNVGVAKVELRANGALVATDSSAPYSFSWDSTRVANGMASLDARAYDAAGNVRSSTVSVNVANVTNETSADTVAPTVGISSPSNGQKVSGTTYVRVGADDNAGLKNLRVELLINGKVVKTSTGTGALTYRWSTAKIRPGTYTLVAKARDAAGNIGTMTISVTR